MRVVGVVGRVRLLVLLWSVFITFTFRHCVFDRVVHARIRPWRFLRKHAVAFPVVAVTADRHAIVRRAVASQANRMFRQRRQRQSRYAKMACAKCVRLTCGIMGQSPALFERWRALHSNGQKLPQAGD